VLWLNFLINSTQITGIISKLITGIKQRINHHLGLLIISRYFIILYKGISAYQPGTPASLNNL
jgi:glycerol-3-phosphate responsive antiterminator